MTLMNGLTVTTVSKIPTNENGEIVLRINAMRVFTYDVETLVESIREDNRDITGEMEITWEDVLSYAEVLANDDFTHTQGEKLHDLIMQDENGNDL